MGGLDEQVHQQFDYLTPAPVGMKDPAVEGNLLWDRRLSNNLLGFLGCIDEEVDKIELVSGLRSLYKRVCTVLNEHLPDKYRTICGGRLEAVCDQHTGRPLTSIIPLCQQYVDELVVSVLEGYGNYCRTEGFPWRDKTGIEDMVDQICNYVLHVVQPGQPVPDINEVDLGIKPIRSKVEDLTWDLLRRLEPEINYINSGKDDRESWSHK